MMHRTGCTTHGPFSACVAIAPSGRLADRSGCTGLSAAPGGGLAEKGDYARLSAASVEKAAQVLRLRRADSYAEQLHLSWAGRKACRERRLRRIRQLRKCYGFAELVACRARMHFGWVHSCAKPAAAPGMAAVRNGLRRARQLR